MLSTTEYLPRLYAHIDQHVELGQESKDQLAKVLRAKRVLKHQYLLEADSICQYENFVVQGCLRMFFVDEKGTEHTLNFTVENWWMCDLESFLRGTPSEYHIQALENTIVLQINAAALEMLYQKAPGFERYFRILHQNSFIAQSKRILQNISLTGEERYEAFQKIYAQWHQRIPQKYIASYLGITPVFLSQIRKQRSIRGKLK